MTTTLQVLSPSQTSKEVPCNENFETLSAAAVFGKRQPATSGLTLGYYGGLWASAAISNGTVTLTDDTTNYVVAHRSTGAVSVSTATTNWNNTSTYARLYKLTTEDGAVTAEEDHRAGSTGLFGNSGSAGDVVGPASSVSNNIGTFNGTSGKLLQDSGISIDTDGTLAANSNTKLPTQQAVKTYVDAKVAGLSWKLAVRVATTAAGTLASDFENGDTVDGVTLATGDRILVKDQATASENGIRVVAASGAPARATDADSGAELVNASVYVSEGTTNADTQWTCTTNAPITVGSTSLAFAQLTSGGGSGDASTNTSSSVDSEVALFSGTGGKTLKRATGTGLAKLTSGVLSTATEGTDYYGPGGTDVAVADGGTGASTASGARTNLGLVIGTDVQAHDADLATIAGLTATTDNFLQAKSSAWASRTPAQVAADLSSLIKPTECIYIACSDEATPLTTGTAKVTFRMPYAMTLSDVRASVTTAPTGGTLLTVDVNESGTKILSTKLTFDASEKTTTTAATPRVISDTSLADDAEITIDIDAVGSTIAGAGLKVYLIGTRT